jgi:hypothetical protein
MAAERDTASGGTPPMTDRERIGTEVSRLAHEFANVVTVLVMRLNVLASELPGDATLHRQDVEAAMAATEEARDLTARLSALGRALRGRP